jgi:zeta-carotene desaturase
MTPVSSLIYASCMTQTQQPTAVVIGGGVAGVSAAVRLAEHGWAVTLLEQRACLGGRASSVKDTKVGLTLDNGQHVVMRACTNLLDLYRRLGVADRITWHERIAVADPDQPTIRHTLAGDDLPAPLHLARLVFRLGWLSKTQRLQVIRGAISAMQVGNTTQARAAYVGMTFSDWLREQGQPVALVRRFWEPIITSACNLPCEEVSAEAALHVLHEGLLSREDASHLGVPSCPLAELLEPAIAIIEKVGGSVRTGTTVQRVEFGNGRVTGAVLNSGEVLTAVAYFSAVPADRLMSLLPEAVRKSDVRLGKLDALEPSPIVSVHLLLGSPRSLRYLREPVLMVPDRPVHWFFDRGLVQVNRDQGGSVRAQHVVALISAASGLVNEPADRIAQSAEDELLRVCPEAREATILHSRVIKEKQATFKLTPGVSAHRPGNGTRQIDNLLLAGDWCDTGWPATMEGAARSGDAAAGVLVKEMPAVEERRASTLYRLLAG